MSEINKKSPQKLRVVIVGAGFGGIACARELLGKPEVDVTIVDRHSYHLFSPLLYQVSTAGLPDDDIAYPVRAAVRGAHYQRGEAIDVDATGKQLVLLDGKRLAYDALVLAVGTEGNDFGIPGVAENALQMKSLAEAREIRKALLGTYEEVAAGHLTPEALHTVVIGGGPTGVELAGAVAELQRGLAREFSEIAKEAGVELVEAGPRLLPSFSEKSSSTALRDLKQLGVNVFTGVGVTKVGPQEVLLSDGRVLPAGVIIWAAGVAAPKVWSKLGETAAGNRLMVDDTLYLKDGIWVIGDASFLRDEAGRPLPQVAPVAMQGGRHVAKQILRMRDGLERERFRYKDKGQMATIGRRRAVVELPNGLKLTGTPAWLAWLLLHVAYLAGGRNRLSVVADWAWNYIAWGVGPPRTLTD